MNSRIIEGPDEYADDDDAGFNLIEAEEHEFVELCEKLGRQYDFPARAVKPSTQEDLERIEKKKKEAAEKEKMNEDDSTNILKEL